MEQKKFEWNENNIGKYLVGIIASCMIFIGVAIMAKSYWEYIEDMVKFLGTFTAGAGIGGFAYWNIRKGRKNPFFISLLGCGMGVSYVSLVASKLAWDLFSDVTVLIMLFFWLIIGIIICRKIKFEILYCIIQFSNLVSVGLALLFMDTGVSCVLVGFFILVTVVIASYFSHRYFGLANRVLSSGIMTVAYLGITRKTCQLMPEFYYETFETFSKSFLGFYLILLIVAMILIVHILKGIHGLKLDLNRMLMVVQLFVVALCARELCFVISDLELFHNSLILSNLASLGILSVVFISKKERWLGFAVVSWMLAINLSNLSLELFFVEGFLVSVATLAVMYIWLQKSNNFLKFSFLVFYCCSFVMVMKECFYSYGIEGFIWISYIILMIIPAYIIGDECIQQKEKHSSGTINICMWLFFLTTNAFFIYIEGWMAICQILIITLFFIVHEFLKRQGKGKVIGVNYVIFLVIIELMMLRIVNLPSDLLSKRVVETTIFLIYTVFLLVESIQEDQSKPICGWTVIMCCVLPVNLYACLEANGFSGYGILVSLICLIVALFYIIIGFSLKAKQIRVVGLILSMLSVFKMVFFDMEYGSAGIRAGGFVAGGIICFIINWIYNKYSLSEKEKEE